MVHQNNLLRHTLVLGPGSKGKANATKPWTAASYKLLSHQKKDNGAVLAKIWVDSPGGNPSSETELTSLWERLNGKTAKILSLDFFVGGMDHHRDPSWAIARASDKKTVTIRTFNTRLPK